MMDLENLPAIAKAKLPDNYQMAVKAIQACVKMDECQKWGHKAEALASYAKQSQDDRLRKYADRIQARAIRRCGELLKQIEPGKNRYDSRRDGGGPSNRKEAARKAGLSERQHKTAIRVANVPEKDFEASVEDAEIAAKAEEHYSSARGHNLHADELLRFIKSRKQAELT